MLYEVITGLVVRRERQAHLERAPGGLAAGRIAVEAENNLVGEAQQLRHVHGGGRGAQRRITSYNVCYTKLLRAPPDRR